MKSLALALLFSMSIPTLAHEGRKAACAEELVRSPFEIVVSRAQDVLPLIRRSLSDEISRDEHSYYEPIVLAAEASLTKHNALFADKKKWRSLDLPRHLEILRTIADFDPRKAKFSLYKIKRAIEARHSLKEYVNCRE